jgi:hypothetical protein
MCEVVLGRWVVVVALSSQGDILLMIIIPSSFLLSTTHIFVETNLPSQAKPTQGRVDEFQKREQHKKERESEREKNNPWQCMCFWIGIRDTPTTTIIIILFLMPILVSRLECMCVCANIGKGKLFFAKNGRDG